MKTIFIALLFLFGIGGYFYYTNSLTPQPEIVNESKPDIFVTPATTTTMEAEPAQISVFENKEHSFTFKYRINPYGYSLFENNAQQNTEQGTLFGVTLVRTTDYNDSVKASAEGNAHDGPPSMSVYVFTAPLGTNLAQWLEKNKILSNCEEGTVMPISVAGEAGASCLWDGLYAGETRAVQKTDKIYLIMGTRENMETQDGYSYAKDYIDMVESFTFIN